MKMQKAIFVKLERVEGKGTETKLNLDMEINTCIINVKMKKLKMEKGVPIWQKTNDIFTIRFRHWRNGKQGLSKSMISILVGGKDLYDEEYEEEMDEDDDMGLLGIHVDVEVLEL